MKTLRFILLVLLVALLVAPAAFAKTKTPVYIQSAEVYTKNLNQGVQAEIKVCSTNQFRTKFQVHVENTTVNAEYKRKLLSIDNGCHSYTLKFNDKFSDISTAGDEMVFSLRKIQAQRGEEKFDEPKTAIRTVEERDTAETGCSDQTGGDDVYTACVGDFITHEPTGLRFRVKAYEKKYVDLVVTGVRWGGSEKVRIYTDRTKKVISGNEKSTRVEITHVGRSEDGEVELLIETTSK